MTTDNVGSGRAVWDTCCGSEHTDSEGTWTCTLPSGHRSSHGAFDSEAQELHAAWPNPSTPLALGMVTRDDGLRHRIEELIERRDQQHAAYCCTVDCPDGGEHIDPTDPVHIDELVGIFGDNPPPMRAHRTIACPGVCTCPTGPDVAEIRRALDGDA